MRIYDLPDENERKQCLALIRYLLVRSGYARAFGLEYAEETVVKLLSEDLLVVVVGPRLEDCRFEFTEKGKSYYDIQ